MAPLKPFYNNKPPKMPNVPHFDWVSIEVKDIKVGDILYSDSFDIATHFGLIVEISDAGIIKGRWTNEFPHLQNTESLATLSLLHFTKEDKHRWYRLEKQKEEYVEYDQKMEDDEPPFDIKIVEKELVKKVVIIDKTKE
jgi:hypothetical protein